MKTQRSINAGKARVGTIAAAGLLALGGLMTTGVGISHADTLQTQGSYPSRAACEADALRVEAVTGGSWSSFLCIPDPTAADTWRLVLSN